MPRSSFRTAEPATGMSLVSNEWPLYLIRYCVSYPNPGLKTRADLLKVTVILFCRAQKPGERFICGLILYDPKCYVFEV